MPWTIRNATDERVRFVIEVERGVRTMTAVCALFGITRETGCKWLGRYAAGGFHALSDASRARLSQFGAVSADISEKLLTLRKKRPHWGPKKLRAVLMREWPLLTWPAASTIGDLLQRSGLVETRRVRVPALSQTRPFAEANEPHDLWCIDFKGWFRTLDGQRCDPLTVSDATSRFLLACEIVAPTTEGVWPACERLFIEHGQPRALRMDNGPPFGSKGAAGLAKLSVCG